MNVEGLKRQSDQSKTQVEELSRTKPETIPLDIRHNLGTRSVKPLRSAEFPDAGAAVRDQIHARPPGAVDVMLVNPPSPDGGIWIRTQHRVGRRSREEMVWPQCSLAQLGAMVHPDYTIDIVDAIAERMTWSEFEERLRVKAPRYYITHVTAPTLTNDLYGVMLAKSLGAKTMAFGTHVTPMPTETMRDYPALDFVLRGEPELTFRALIDTLEVARGRWQIQDGHLRTSAGEPIGSHVMHMFSDADPRWRPPWSLNGAGPTDHVEAPTVGQGPAIATRDRQAAVGAQLATIKGLVWRDRGEIRINPDRPFLPNLDDLPMPLHHLLPLEEYRMPLMKGPFTFIVTSRGCPAGCKFCIKHVSYQWSVRLHSPERIMQELWLLHDLGIHNIHMYADLFTVNRDQVMGLCELIIKEGLKIKWTCNSRVDYVDEEMLTMMGRAGCWMISWGIESANEQILKQIAKGYRKEQALDALRWSKNAGIKNWGYFIIGLPGETVESIRETIDFSKQLPLDLALFHIAAPYPGTPFFFEVVENGWFREGTQWEQIDMDKGTVLEYDNLSAEDLMYWQKQAFREWAFRPGPAMTYLKMLFSDTHTFKRAVRVGMEHLGWALG